MRCLEVVLEVGLEVVLEVGNWRIQDQIKTNPRPDQDQIMIRIEN